MTPEAMAVRERLRSYSEIKQEATALDEKIETLWSRLTTTSKPPREIDIQTNADPKGTEKLLISLADMEVKRDKLRIRIAIQREEIEGRIGRLNGIDACVLKLRYVDGLTLDAAADALEYCPRHLARIHARALHRLAKMSC